jgi:hypothetical protein
VPATFYRPTEVAKLLRCSQWWVKEQARKRRIPFCWIGGSYLFTPEHIAEIVRLFEVRPVETVTPDPRARPAARQPNGQGYAPPILLHARPPRRARKAGMPDSTAA